jgi:EXLDI family protein
MPNKTIYVSESDASLFEEAKEIAGETLSSVIARSLREYVTRHQQKSKGMKDVSLLIGKGDAEREVRFVGMITGEWKGFSDDKKWWMSANVYQTQKGKWAVHLMTVAKATLLTDKKAWKESGDYLIDPRQSELIVGEVLKDFEKNLPSELLDQIQNLIERNEKPVEYLDI